MKSVLFSVAGSVYFGIGGRGGVRVGKSSGCMGRLESAMMGLPFYRWVTPEDCAGYVASGVFITCSAHVGAFLVFCTRLRLLFFGYGGPWR
jgi:hypothetical protein